MKNLDEIKKLMVAGDTAEADKALKELLEKEPNNLHAKMLYGTCRQLLGDEENFKRIHDELAPVLERLVEKEPNAETVSLWKKYQRLWEYLIAASLIVAGVGTAAWFFGKDIQDMFGLSNRAVVGRPTDIDSLYGGPRYHDRQLYGGPRRDELIQAMEHDKKFIKTSGEDTATIE